MTEPTEFPCWACGKLDCDNLACGLDRCRDCGRTADELVANGHAESCSQRVRLRVEVDAAMGAAVLDNVHNVLKSYVIFPSESACVAFTLWIAATHAQPSWHHATRFALKSPIKRCGKTRAQEVARELAYEPLPTVNISAAALVHSLDEKDPPTLFIDEADTIFGRKANEGAEDVRGILNAGHSRGWPYVRWDPKTRQRDECPTFAMAIVGGIGDLPDTVEDRAVVVSMRRRAPGEKVRSFRRRDVPALHELRGLLSDWVTAVAWKLDTAEPALPVEDREADVWESLVAVADAAGDHWPERARKACVELCGATTFDEGTLGERLLADLKDVWKDDEDHLPTATTLERLKEIEEAPWDEGWGKPPKPLSAHSLARLLRPYGVKSTTFRLGESTPKGYSRQDLADCWRRYATGATEQHEDEKPEVTRENGRCASVADSDFATATGADQGEQARSCGVADVADVRLEPDIAEQLSALDPDDPDHGVKVAALRAEAVRRKRGTP